MKEGERLVTRPEPLEMSTYLSGMFSQYGMTNARSSLAIQKLYEKGFTSYPRTDSVRISSTAFLDKTEKMIKKDFGEEMFLGLGEFKPKKRRKVTEQDAHEAIRPTKITNKPEDLKEKLSDIEYKAYSYI
jgi:DNA topoisomerase-1